MDAATILTMSVSPRVVALLTVLSSLGAAQQTGVPDGWLVYSPTGGYTARLDDSQKHSGERSALVQGNASQPEAFGTLMQTVRAEQYRGRRVRLSGYLRTRVVNWAGLWMRIDSREQWSMTFDNMANRPVRGTTDWSSCAVVLDVPKQAIHISFGVILSGNGQVWADDLQLQIVNRDIATTDMRMPSVFRKVIERPELPAAPVNTGFEK